MRDNALIILVRTALLARLESQGILVEGKQSNQPTTQGIPSGPTLFFTKILDRRYGHPQRTDEWDEDEQVFRHIESQAMETTIQFAAIAPQNPGDDTEMTTADILKAGAAALQSDVVLSILRAEDVGVLRVADIRNGYAIDDKDQFQANPTFDVVFTHRDTTIDSVPALVGYEVLINRV